MKVSVCITTKDESRDSIKKLLDALNKQTIRPEEIIITDASNSKFQFLNSKQYLKTNIQIINRTGVSRAEGRNIAIKQAGNEIVATTDCGCVPRRDWLEKLIGPFKIASSQAPRNDIVVAGFYHMTYKNSLQKAMRVFLGILPEKFDDNFLPSARSMAFTKTIWKKAGGFPENLNNTAEDTLFNVNLIKAGAKFIRVKNAVVEWGMPESISKFQVTIFKYAMGDGQAGIWWHPVKQFQSHNIKILTVYLRYLLFILFFVKFGYLYLFIFICIYLFFAFYKAGLWGLILQPVSDIAVMSGFGCGIMSKWILKKV